MIKLIKTELIKIQWKSVLLLIFIDVLVSSILAINAVNEYKEIFIPDWNTLYFQEVELHAIFFFPLLAGIFASLICSYEHKNRGWKQILTLPYSRLTIYFSKFIVIMIILLIVQLSFLLGYIITGYSRYKIQLAGVISWKTVVFGVVAGYFAIFPLASLQLWLSTKFESFSRALILNISMVIPNIVITGFHSYIGAWIPYSSAYYAMFPQGINLSPRVEWNSFFLITFFTFVFYLTKGCQSFSKKDWI
ncbi:ABC-2 family transporter protein [Clostridium puniceum]|uniref:ABC-2 family transporter protein n=1 Tax=Clostridium puniceum TaxID=29367 RepID=A0A1S8TE48_9CLOT|nr:ABC transporter permease [Clostridium puniceum]OOM75912.1 ABC-2 family transporter protein [Clostridium puniceum]